MKRRRLRAVGYALALLVQGGVLVGAWELHQLSQTKMMVMRYLVAQNVALESTWFAPFAVLAQTAAFLVVAIAGVLAAIVPVRRGRWFAAAQGGLLAALAACGVWLTSLSAEDVWALYAAVIAVWIALLVQSAVTAAAARTVHAGARDPEKAVR